MYRRLLCNVFIQKPFDYEWTLWHPLLCENLIFFNGIGGKLYHLIKLCVRNTQYKVLFVGKLQIRNL